MRLTYVFALRTYQHIDTAELVLVARCLSNNHFFGNPFPVPTGPTAIVAPGYALLLSLIYSMFGTGIGAQAVQETICSLVTSLGIGAIVLFSESAEYKLRVGVFAGALGALLPTKLWIETKGAWSTPYDSLILVLLATLTLRQWKRPQFTLSLAILNGFLWGLAMLFAPAFFPILVGFLLAGLFIFTKERPKYTRWACLLLVVSFLVLTPWTIRNYRELGGFFFIRDNLGLEVYNANNDRARPTLEENLKLPKRVHPNDNPMEAAELARLGELRYNQDKLKVAVRWIVDHPKQFSILSAQRFLHFWFPSSNQMWKRIVSGAITLLALTGFVLSCRTYRLAAVNIAVIWLVYPPIYYLVQADPRYPYPIYWTLLLMAAVSILRLIGIMRGRLGKMTAAIS
jgi:hypothetical protein